MARICAGPASGCDARALPLPCCRRPSSLPYSYLQRLAELLVARRRCCHPPEERRGFRGCCHPQNRRCFPPAPVSSTGSASPYVCMFVASHTRETPRAYRQQQATCHVQRLFHTTADAEPAGRRQHDQQGLPTVRLREVCRRPSRGAKGWHHACRAPSPLTECGAAFPVRLQGRRCQGSARADHVVPLATRVWR